MSGYSGTDILNEHFFVYDLTKLNAFYIRLLNFIGLLHFTTFYFIVFTYTVYWQSDNWEEFVKMIR